MSDKRWIRRLRVLGACDDAVAWARGYASLGEAWAVCERGDWTAWLLDATDAWPEGGKAEYERVKGAAWAEYERVEGAAWAEYERVCACAIRRIVPTPPELPD